MRVLIVGAGYGGLALAASLHRDSHTVTLIEKGEEGARAPCYDIGA